MMCFIPIVGLLYVIWKWGSQQMWPDDRGCIVPLGTWSHLVYLASLCGVLPSGYMRLMIVRHCSLDNKCTCQSLALVLLLRKPMRFWCNYLHLPLIWTCFPKACCFLDTLWMTNLIWKVHRRLNWCCLLANNVGTYIVFANSQYQFLKFLLVKFPMSVNYKLYFWTICSY
jgi:hypothetical protein